MAKPKLALIPAAQGSKLFSVLPSSGVGDFDFSRSGKATRINSQGLIEEVANGQSRLNYPMIDGKVVGCPHHILEPQRTNLIQYSEDFSQWTKENAPTVVISSELAPNGIIDAYDITDEGSGYRYIRSNSISFNGTYTGSIFIRKTLGALSHYAGLEICLAGSYLIIDTTDGSINQTSNDYSNIKSEDFGNWWRVSATATNNSTGNILQVWSAISSNGTSISSSAQGTNTFWGAQVESGSYPTSYIPNYGTAAGVTRQAETANGSGDAATFNDSEGVLMAEVSALADDLTYRGISIGDGTANNLVRFYYENISNRITAQIKNAGVAQATMTYTFSNITISSKIVIKYKLNDFALWVNGFEVGNDTSGSIPSSLSSLQFDTGTGGDKFYGKTKQIQYFQTALTDSELETLTSWTSFTDMANGQLYTIE